MSWNVTTKKFNDDGSVSVYFGSVWLCHDDTLTEALEEAKVILNAVANGAYWATTKFPELVGVV